MLKSVPQPKKNTLISFATEDELLNFKINQTQIIYGLHFQLSIVSKRYERIAKHSSCKSEVLDNESENRMRNRQYLVNSYEVYAAKS